MLNKHEKLKQKVKTLPETPGIYLMKDYLGAVIYVGKAKLLKQRVQSYFQQNNQHSKKVQRLVFNIADFEIREVDTELDALLLECQLIQTYHPLYNRQLNYSTNYCYLTLSATGFKFSTEPSKHSYGPFKQYKRLPQICQFLSELYQMPWIPSITTLKLQNQNPVIRDLPLATRFEALDNFFTNSQNKHKKYMQQWLDTLIEAEAFEQAATLHKNIEITNRFYEQIQQINRFNQTKMRIFTIPLTNGRVKYYQLAYGRIIYTKILKNNESFKPCSPPANPHSFEKSELDLALILIAYLKKTSEKSK